MKTVRISATNPLHKRVWTAGIADDVNKNRMTYHVTVAVEFQRKKGFVHSLQQITFIFHTLCLYSEFYLR